MFFSHNFCTNFGGFAETRCIFTLSILISLSAIFLMMGLSSDSTNFLMATIWPVSLFLHLKTTPYEPSPIFPIFSYFSILRRKQCSSERRQNKNFTSSSGFMGRHGHLCSLKTDKEEKKGRRGLYLIINCFYEWFTQAKLQKLGFLKKTYFCSNKKSIINFWSVKNKLVLQGWKC